MECDARHTEGEPLDALMRAFYEVISFEEGGAPDWTRMARVFSKHARITRVTPEAIDFMDLAAFRNMAEDLAEQSVFGRRRSAGVTEPRSARADQALRRTDVVFGADPAADARRCGWLRTPTPE